MREILIEAARETLQTEIDQIVSLPDRLGNAFADACTMMLACRGKVIVSGMGKSGHIGKKSLLHWPAPEPLHFMCIPPKPCMVILV